MSGGDTNHGYLGYWGKTGKGEHRQQFHLLPYHCLDVAAVGEVLLQRHTSLSGLFTERLELATPTFLAWHRFFLALHDMGKFSFRFQGLREDLLRKLQGIQTRHDYTWRHDSLGWLLWSKRLRESVLTADRLGFEPSRHWRNATNLWVMAVTGHHGQPPKDLDESLSGEGVFLPDQFSPSDIQAALQFANDCGALMLSSEKLDAWSDTKALLRAIKPLSWWLAGIAVLCDWLGSGRHPDDYQTGAMPLERYWHEHALPFAQTAVIRSGLLPLKSTHHELDELFEYLNPPSPLQKAAAELHLPNEPALFVIEDVTGSGKTEAALMLAHRLIADGKADGLYIGLPSMATSNAMYKRIEGRGIHRRLFQEEPALLLAHSASHMRRADNRQEHLDETAPEADYAKDEDSAATQRDGWLLDNRKKALLADFGIGTIDQALLAVLYSRHQSLRLLGLARKVLIVDEVHACDVYMQRLLEEVLTFHATVGGSAILLSATLPRETRQQLVDSFYKGLGPDAPGLTATAYPLLTQARQGGITELPLATRPAVARRVETRLLHSTAQVYALLQTAHRAGQCACWIRNTVGDALEAMQSLRDSGIPGDCLMLFHARFALGDRSVIETRVLEKFGPESRTADRQGRILIATQVVEQSLDLDFDVMVSDLAPIDLLIQRSGRLHRHKRDPQGNPASSEQRENPVLHVLGPEMVEQPPADWYSAFSPGAARVYPHHGHLWLSTRLMEESGAIVMPEGARDLIEGVYGADAEEQIPEGLINNATEVAGNRSAERSMARYNLVSLRKGYTSDGLNYWEDAQTPTRLGDPSTTVRLACWEDGKLRPWNQDPKHAWSLSQLSVRESLIKEEAPITDNQLHEAVEHYRDTVFDKGRWSKLLVLSRDVDNNWRGEAINQSGEVLKVVYDDELGLQKVQ